MDKSTPGPSSVPIAVADATVLLAVLGRYEAKLRGGSLDPTAVTSLWGRLVAVGLADEDTPASPDVVADEIDALGQRLRHALGEYPVDPASGPR
jgi:hypothetical protein